MDLWHKPLRLVKGAGPFALHLNVDDTMSVFLGLFLIVVLSLAVCGFFSFQSVSFPLRSSLCSWFCSSEFSAGHNGQRTKWRTIPEMRFLREDQRDLLEHQRWSLRSCVRSLLSSCSVWGRRGCQMAGLEARLSEEVVSFHEQYSLGFCELGLCHIFAISLFDHGAKWGNTCSLIRGWDGTWWGAHSVTRSGLHLYLLLSWRKSSVRCLWFDYESFVAALMGPPPLPPPPS